MSDLANLLCVGERLTYLIKLLSSFKYIILFRFLLIFFFFCLQSFELLTSLWTNLFLDKIIGLAGALVLTLCQPNKWWFFLCEIEGTTNGRGIMTFWWLYVKLVLKTLHISFTRWIAFEAIFFFLSFLVRRGSKSKFILKLNSRVINNLQ